VPQLSRRNIAGNQPIVDLLKNYAQIKGTTPAQISLAWMLHKYPNVVPIPGSKNKERIVENLEASNVVLTNEEFTALEDSLNRLEVYGHRGLGGF
jgi:aryl-alcohol dehydrogenase-like predicted oxidoreductase